MNRKTNSKYIEVFGTKVEPSTFGLPVLFLPSEAGWISQAQEDLATSWDEGSDELVLLSMLNEKYFQQHFGKKKLPKDYSLICEHWQEYGYESFDAASTEIQDNIDYFLYMRIPMWCRMMNAMYAEYDPISNYNRHEETTDTLTYTGSETDTKAGSEEMAKTGSEELAKTGKEVSQPSGTETTTTQNNVNGYNSDTSVPSSDSEITTSFDQRKDEVSFDQRKDTTSFNNRKDTLTFNQRTDTHSFTDRADTREIESDIYGNIGVTTNQQMILSEIDLRRENLMYRFHKEIADRFLLSVY